jgi:23S rRNA G2445 N2-methylase RlmL
VRLGTIPIEAALMVRRIPPGLGRTFAFEQWPASDAKAWGDVVGAARERILSAAGVLLIGSDRDAGAVEAAIGNAKRAGVADDVEWRRASISAVEPRPPGDGSSPTRRTENGSAIKRLRDLYAQVETSFGPSAPGWELAMLTRAPGARSPDQARARDPSQHGERRPARPPDVWPGAVTYDGRDPVAGNRARHILERRGG